MVMKLFFSSIVLFMSISIFAQEKPYYYQIPDTPKVYTATTVAARLVDGLGFRFYWATEGLTEKDLQFKPSKDARTSLETIEHIKGLTDILLNAVSKRTTKTGIPQTKLSFNELREAVLNNIRSASEILKSPDAKLEDFDMIFEGANSKTEYPFWNLVNGPISDALWHVGQVVTFRRSSGNPLPAGVGVLQGIKRD